MYVLSHPAQRFLRGRIMVEHLRFVSKKRQYRSSQLHQLTRTFAKVPVTLYCFDCSNESYICIVRLLIDMHIDVGLNVNSCTTGILISPYILTIDD